MLDEKTVENASSAVCEKIKLSEANRIEKYIKNDAVLVTLEIDGKMLDSVELAGKISKWGVDGFSNRTIVPSRNSNGNITGYTISKTAIVMNGSSKVYKKVLSESDIYPFMEVVLPEQNVMNIESIVVKNGTDNTLAPSYGIFYGSGCPEDGITRFYEVNNLARLHMALRLGIAHGYRAHPHHHLAEGHHLPHGEEELYELGEDACAQTETRRGHKAV